MEEENIKDESKTFAKRLDFYWQFIAVYSVALIIIALFMGSIEDGRLSLALTDPPVILLAVFVLFSVIGFFYNYYMNKKLIVGKDYIIFKSRFRERKYHTSEIARIAFARERKKSLEGAAEIRIIKIRVKNRRRVIKLRTSSFRDEQDMLRYIDNLKRNIKS
jgi:hypothetical protein